MVKWAGSAKHVLAEFFVKFAIGFGLGAAGDAVVEFFRVPVLNDTGTFNDPNTSNYEYMIYILGSFGTAAGVADIGIGGKGVLGFSRHTMPVMAGLAVGTYFWEHTLSNLLGWRKWNPYELAGRLVPPVLPGSFPHPGVTPGQPFPGSQEEQWMPPLRA